MSVFFSRFMGNESQCGTNKSHENRNTGLAGSRFVYSCSRYEFTSIVYCWFVRLTCGIAVQSFGRGVTAKNDETPFTHVIVSPLP